MTHQPLIQYFKEAQNRHARTTPKIENQTLPTSSEMLVSRINTGTKTTLTNQKRNPIHNVATINREAIIESVINILESIQQGISDEMGDVDYERKVINPYNPKIKKKSLVNMRDRIKVKNNIYPKVKVNNSILDRMRKKVRVYVYKTIQGGPFAVKQEHMPKQPYNPNT